MSAVRNHGKQIFAKVSRILVICLDFFAWTYQNFTITVMRVLRPFSSFHDGPSLTRRIASLS